MKQGIKRILSLVMAVLMTVSFFGAVVLPASAAERKVYDHVVIIGMDGAGNLFGADTPRIDALMQQGASTLTGHNEYPTESAVNWVSLLTGVPYADHGIINSNIGADGPYNNLAYPTIFKLVRQAKPEAKLASFVNWAPVNDGAIEADIGVEMRQFSASTAAQEDADLTADAIEYIATESPNLMFIHFDSADAAGHASGYNSDAQRETIATLDGYVGQIYDTVQANKAMKDNTLFIVTSDHGGGTNKYHGHFTEQEKNIFYVVAGESVNHNVDLEVYLRDTPAIVAYALDVPGGENWNAAVPQNLFADNMNPPARNCVTEKAALDTPKENTGAHISDYVDLSDLKAGFFFDENMQNIVDTDVTAESVGIVRYTKGYYGNAAHVSGAGYITANDLTFGADSFSIAMWVNREEVYDTDPVLYGNQDWEYGNSVGFTVPFNKAGKNNTVVRLGNGSDKLSIFGTFPAEKLQKWVHTLLVVNRETQTVDYYWDFVKVGSMDISKMGTLSIDSGYPLTVGMSATGSYRDVVDAQVDDLLIFDKALSADDISALSDYYDVSDNLTVFSIEKNCEVRLGETYIFNPTVVPAIADHGVVKWTSSDASVASVQNGVVTANKAGTATITASFNGKSATCTVKVVGAYATPEDGSGRSLSDFISLDKLKAGFFFDEDMQNIADTDVTAENVGVVGYTDGYYGNAAHVNAADVSGAGYITTDGLTFGADSFSIAMWVNREEVASGDPVLYGNQNWNKGASVGFTVPFNKAGKNNTVVRLANGSDKLSIFGTFPAEKLQKWVHTLLVVNRETKTVDYYWDFVKVGSMDISKMGTLSIDSGYPLTVGMSANGTYSYKLEALVDDLLIFDCAVTDGDIKGLATYYGLDNTIVFDKEEYTLDASSSFAFESVRASETNAELNWYSSKESVATVSKGIVSAKAAGTTVITATTKDGKYSASCKVRVVSSPATPETDSGRHLSDFISFDKLKAGFFFDGNTDEITSQNATAKEQGQIGYGDGFYGKAAHIAPGGYINTSGISFGKDDFSIAVWVYQEKTVRNSMKDQYNYWDPVLCSNQDWLSSKNPGFTIPLGTRSATSIAVADGTTENRVLLKNGIAAENVDGWVHVLAVFDRTDKTLKYYENFEFVGSEDISKLDGYDLDSSALPLTLGMSAAGSYKYHPDFYADDLLVFDSAVSEDDIDRLAAYYGFAMTFDETEYTVNAGSSLTLAPLCAFDESEVFDWDSENEEVATVVNGVVSAEAEGTTVITAATKDGKYSASCTVNVTDYEAAVGQTGYASLEEALTAAQAGDTIRLMQNVSVQKLILSKAVTLDLGGKVLTADYVVGFKGSAIGGEGKLIVDKDKVSLDRINAGYLPVYEENGYIFTTVKLDNRTAFVNEQTYAFSPVFETFAHEALAKGYGASNVKIVIRLTWEDAGNYKAIQDFTYVDEMVKTVIGSYDAAKGNYARAFSAAFAGSEAGQAENVKVSAVVLSDTGVEIASVAITFETEVAQ